MKLRIEKAIYGGAGLGRVDGQAVFVPKTLPGELVEAIIQRDKGGYAEATLQAIREPSPARTQPPCPYYGTCGGCQYQHATYATQLALKESILHESLQRAGIVDTPTLTTHSAQPWGYRNRIRLHVHPVTHRLCYREGGSHRLVAIDTCPIAAPLLQRALPTLQTIGAAESLGKWCDALELFTNHDGSQLLLHLVPSPAVQNATAQFQRLCATAAEQIPELIGAALISPARVAEARPQSRKGRSAAKRIPRHTSTPQEPDAGTQLATWGQPWLTYQVGAAAYRVSAGAFFQGNRFLVEALQNIATADTPGTTAWDLYAGVGLFALALQAQGTDVVAVEGSPISGRDLAHNLAHSPASNASLQPGKAVRSSTLSFLEQAKRQHGIPHHIVLDPPRAGLGSETATLLAAIHSHAITYVSCDPATLARDVRILRDAGYTITQLHLVDMFPQTFHLETVVKLRLR